MQERYIFAVGLDVKTPSQPAAKFFHQNAQAYREERIETRGEIFPATSGENRLQGPEAFLVSAPCF
jgi:hypothetical protein